MKKAIVIAAALAATPVAAQTEAFCETLATLSEATALNRMGGVPLYDMIVAAQQHPWEDQGQEDLVIQIMGAVYSSNLSPADAYVMTYGVCVNELRGY